LRTMGKGAVVSRVESDYRGHFDLTKGSECRIWEDSKSYTGKFKSVFLQDKEAPQDIERYTYR
jgi:hypothetical protein